MTLVCFTIFITFEILSPTIVAKLGIDYLILAKYPNFGAFTTCTMDLTYGKRKTKKVGSTIVLIPRP